MGRVSRVVRVTRTVERQQGAVHILRNAMRGGRGLQKVLRNVTGGRGGGSFENIT
jgi:hypothetical protein